MAGILSWLLGGWVAGLVALLVLGSLLSGAVLRTAGELARSRCASLSGGAGLRRAYAAVLWVRLLLRLAPAARPPDARPRRRHPLRLSPSERTRWVRALNARGTVSSVEDARPAWTLFADPVAIQTEMTEAVRQMIQRS